MLLNQWSSKGTILNLLLQQMLFGGEDFSYDYTGWRYDGLFDDQIDVHAPRRARYLSLTVCLTFKNSTALRLSSLQITSTASPRE